MNDISEKKKILNLLPMGNQGGVERLCLEVAKYSEDENFFYFMWSGGDIADRIRKYTENIEVRNFSYRRILSEYRFFREYVKKNEIEIIVVQMPSPIFLLFLSRIKKYRPDLKICAYIHADPVDIFTSNFKKKQFGRFLKRADGCIAISKFVSQETRNMFRNRDIKVIYNGTDIGRFDGGKIPGDGGKVRLIYVGRLIKEKGVDLLIRVLSKSEFDFNLTVVGDGPCKLSLKGLADTLGIGDKVRFLGARNDVDELLRNADIFVHPAVWNEGFGIAIIEAMAAGIPCVAFDKGAVSEIITDNIDGFLVSDLSEKGYKERLWEVVQMYAADGGSFDEVCRNAKKRASDFNIQYYIKELNTYLHGL